ncbi:hypothetical protein BS50DRAFT_159036 [Corynespora cassiicola Philippines]|uniref:Sucrase/ferredoxin-like family protein n=1 Tax=Corynespora cassiicola Philippines TaxID=1448308 RepID=A0A2T2N779_CORCC|nr:hypothetical protein BS50DRAFT_159036 [Corynespora cassiicola Philippines]
MAPLDSSPKANAYRMTATLKNLYYKLSPAPSTPSTAPSSPSPSAFSKARTTSALFPTTDAAVDGDDCLHDCASCTIKYPSKFTIDETEELYGHVKGWSTHLIVATGKTDWVRDVADEKGSIMEAVEKGHVKPTNGKLMLSASNMPVPDHADHSTSVLLLPSFQLIDNVTAENTPELITEFVNKGPTNTTPLAASISARAPSPSTLRARPCPHDYLILLCSQKTRDARCGQSAPLLRREFERHLRPLGLYRDLHDERPGGVGIYFISHVGGHKFSANVMVYRKASAIARAAQADGEVSDEAAQCIWLARIRPEDCENVVRYTVLQGKVVKPHSQLRGGFDRYKQVVSW